MSRKARLVVRESPFEVLERLQRAVAERLPGDGQESVSGAADVRLHGQVKGDRFAISVRRDPVTMRTKRNSWDPWLTGTVRPSGEGTVVDYRLGPPPAFGLWWKVVFFSTLLTLLLPAGVAIWTDDGVPWQTWLLFVLGMAGFVGALKLIEVVAMRESRPMAEELESLLRRAVEAESR
jgi:hypothetical protein